MFFEYPIIHDYLVLFWILLQIRGGMVVTNSNLTLCLLINGKSERRMMVTKGKYDFEKNIKTLSEIFLLLRYF